MTRVKRKRKCKNCYELYRPDPRNIEKQEYCSRPVCRKASKAASQARWLAKKENKNYFRSSYNVRRVQEWRARHPGYSCNRSKVESALQDDSSKKMVEKQSVNDKLTKDTLQDLFFTQHPVLVGLIAHLTGGTLQDDIVKTTRHMQQLGSDILSSTLTMRGGDYVNKKSYIPGPDP